LGRCQLWNPLSDSFTSSERGVPATAHRRDAPKEGQRPGRWRECAGSSQRRRGGGCAKSPSRWIFASADAVESSEASDPNPHSEHSFFRKGALYYIMGGLCAAPNGGRWSIRRPFRSVGSSRYRKRSKPGRARRRETHRTGRVLTGRHRVAHPTGDRTDPFRDAAELVSSLGDR
jgi:hypothetical protein